MFIILVLISFVLLWAFLDGQKKEKGLRQTFLEAFLLTFVFVFITTETLSLFHLINKYSVTFLWSITTLFIGFLNLRQTKIDFLRIPKNLWQKIKDSPKFYLALALIIYCTTLFISFCYPPNTYDSMTYHLARVGHWIQSGSVSFYPTAILRQLYQAPLAEYSILHLQLLSGNDYFANFPQWISFVACGIVVSLIIRELGEDLKTQLLGVVFSATLPMAIVQSTGTQNDLVVSIFVLSFFYFWLRAVKSNSWTDFIWLGFSLGLALLSKGTAYLFCFPIGLAFVSLNFGGLKISAKRVKFIKQVTVVLVIALAFNFTHLARNYSLFGSPVATGEDKVSNEKLTGKIVFANLVRNYAIHLGTKAEGFNNSVENSLTNFLGDELNNPDSTWLDNKFEVSFSTNEDLAGNFLHILLLTIALFIVPFMKKVDKKYLFCVAFTIILGFILYSLLLKWQIWASRLQTPLFMLGTVLIAIVLSRFKLGLVFAVFSFLLASSFLFLSTPRIVFSSDREFILTKHTRQQNYFSNLSGLDPIYTEAVNFIKSQPNQIESIGLYLGYNDYEYPFWVFLKDDFSRNPYLYHVGMENVSAKLIGERPLPDFVIATKEGNTIEGVEYQEVFEKDHIRVLVKNK